MNQQDAVNTFQSVFKGPDLSGGRNQLVNDELDIRQLVFELGEFGLVEPDFLPEIHSRLGPEAVRRAHVDSGYLDLGSPAARTD